MLPFWVAGRTLARAIFTGINPELGQIKKNGQIEQVRDFHLVTASSGFPKTFSAAQILKRCSFGDDACFIATHRLADVIGVADGVGGWRTYGVDPSQFSHSLMQTCKRLVTEGHFRPSSPGDLIASSYNALLEGKAPIIGSSTACVVSLYRQEKKVYTANLGDSGFLLIRSGKVVHRSEDQTHYFNTPFQLAMAPPMQQGLVISDSPESASSTSFGVEEGDIILVGTDGLFDNMTETMILEHIHKLKDHRKHEEIQRTAHSLASTARDLALDPNYMSPFAVNASDSGLNIKGGKPDDITVIVACVSRMDDGFS